MLGRAKWNQEIPMSDGTILRANIYFPQSSSPWPIILMAYPYMKDSQAGLIFGMEAYRLIKENYAVVIADLRGIGASEGTISDPFEPLNSQDLFELVEWCGKQEWSNGSVGMIGESYGGIAALLAASTQPTSLKAIFTMMAPAFYYENLVFPGGSLNMMGVLGSWINLMNLLTILPPLNKKNLGNWREIWNKRLSQYQPLLLNPSHHPIYDNYWKQLNIPVEKIQTPTYVLDGWNGFTHRDTTQIYQKLICPKKMMIGTWVHYWPNITPKNPIEYTDEAIRWFNYWLKGEQNGIMDEPSIAIYYMGEKQWKYEQNWPPQDTNKVVINLASDQKLVKRPDVRETYITYSVDPTVGTRAGLMSVYTLGIDYPKEQTPDDEKSLTFDTDAIPETLTIVGEPKVQLYVSTNMPDAAITVRLCDIDNEEKSHYITRGWMRLSRRNSLKKPEPPQPREIYPIEIKLLPIAYRLEAMHRLRLSIQLSDFPRIFPLPYKGHLYLHFSKQMIHSLIIPTVKAKIIPTYKPKPKAPDMSLLKGIGTPRRELIWNIIENSQIGETRVQAGSNIVSGRFPGIPKMSISHLFEASVKRREPGSAILTAQARARFKTHSQTYNISSIQTVNNNSAELIVKVIEGKQTLFEKKFKTHINWI